MPNPTRSAARRPAAPRKRYHHGDLRHALIVAAEQVLAERGAEGFTLRECARRAGVSPAAPAHHFGNAAGLLTAVAALGFDGLSDAMENALERLPPPQATSGAARVRAICDAYVAYARAWPDRYRVTFGRMSVHVDDPQFLLCGDRAFRILVREVHRAIGAPGDQPTPQTLPSILLVWSTVHGFVQLALDRRLEFLAAVAGPGADGDGFVVGIGDRVLALLAAAMFDRGIER